MVETSKEVVEKSQLRTEAVYNAEKTHRFKLTKIWSKEPVVTVIGLNPSSSGIVSLDMTTLKIINGLFSLNFGGCEITNLFSLMTTKLSTKGDIKGLYLEENFDYMKRSVETTEKTLIAWGVRGNSNKQVKEIENKVLQMLAKYESKLYCIVDETGKSCHPLCPKIQQWHLQKFEIPKQEQATETDKEQSKGAK